MTHRTCHPPSKYLRPVVRGQLFKIGYICILDILEAQSCVSHAHTDFWAYSLTKFQIGHISENKVRLCGKLYWPICPGNVLCFRVNFCRYLNSECYTSQKPTWGETEWRQPPPGVEKPHEVWMHHYDCFDPVGQTELQICRTYIPHLFWLILKCSVVYGHDSCQLSTQHICINLSLLTFWSHLQQKSIERNVYAFKQILCNCSCNIVAFAIAACFSGTAIAPVFLIQSGNRNAIMTRC